MNLLLILFSALSLTSCAFGLSSDEYDTLVADLENFFLNDADGRNHLATALRLCEPKILMFFLFSVAWLNV